MTNEHSSQQLFQIMPRSISGKAEGRSKHLQWQAYTAEMKKLYKMNSANAILMTINRHHDRMLKENIDWDQKNHAQKEEILNSNLIYLIAATDDYEDNVGHSQLVAKYTLMLAEALGISDEEFLKHIERGALLHDIGKIGIPEAILRKPGALTLKERDVVEEHPEIGYKIIKNFEFLKQSSRVVLYHHEHFSGGGYPFGLAGESIPLEARIFALADTLDAITSDRPYRRGQSFRKARLEIERGKDTQFDPEVVEAFLSVPDETWLKIKQETVSNLSQINSN